MNAPRLQAEPRSGKGSHHARVLLLGEPSLSSYFRRVLEKRGCQCSLGDWTTFDPRQFDLIVSSSPIEDKEGLLLSLEGSGCTVFICQHGDGGEVLWVPIMVKGERGINADALSPNDFFGYLDRMESKLNRAPATA
jgi:hypothetical protein